MTTHTQIPFQKMNVNTFCSLYSGRLITYTDVGSPVSVLCEAGALLAQCGRMVVDGMRLPCLIWLSDKVARAVHVLRMYRKCGCMYRAFMYTTHIAIQGLHNSMCTIGLKVR